MIKKTNNSGWILCPSKSYPGKFYYFNVLNGEAAWCLNENEKKVLKKQVTIQKIKPNQLYPEPITPPDHPSYRASNYHSKIGTSLPTFGQAIFPKYISNDKEVMLNSCTPIQMLQQVTNTKVMMNQNAQTEQDISNVYAHTIPLSKQFENKINEKFASINYVAATQPKDWWNSTNIWSNIGKHSDTPDMQYKPKFATKPIIKLSKLNKLQYSNKNIIYNKHVKQDSTQMYCNKVENPKRMPDKMLINYDYNDSRYVLSSRRNNSVEMQDLFNKVNEEPSLFNNSKKVTLNIRDKTSHSEEKNIWGGTANSDNQQASEWYLVVDLDVLLEDYDFIKRYIDKDENCHLYVPSIIQIQLENISRGEHRGHISMGEHRVSRVIVARQLLRHLGSIMPKLNIPENKEDTKRHQIINCCLEILKQHYDVVLVTKNNELIQAARLYKIKAYHINDLKSNDVKNNIIHTYNNNNNLFLQNTSYFDPFSLSKTIRETDNNYTRNISGANRSLIEHDLDVNENNSIISDINIIFSKLNINDKILNINVESEIVRSNDNVKCTFKTFHNTLLNKTVQRNYKEDIKNTMLNKKENTLLTSNTKETNINSSDNPERCTNLITNPSNEVLENSTNNLFENMLEKFQITNNTMEHNLYVRFDEWVCSYEQIIEEFLYNILQENRQQVSQPPPWFLHEGMECLKDIFSDNKYIINIIQKLLYYYDFSSEKGTNIKPYNFMKLFGCGFHLVVALEGRMKTSPLFISDIKKKLIYQRDMLECPIEDLVSDSPPECDKTEDKQTCRYKFVKNPSDVLDYLKKQYSEWKNYNEDYDNTNQIEQVVQKNNIRVVRTFGRDLNKLTINKSKCISFTKDTDKQTHKNEHHSQFNDYPKVIRNIKIIDTFEDKIKNNKNKLNGPEIAVTISNTLSKAIINDTVDETNDFEIVSVNNDSQNNFSINDINDLTKDSDIGSDSLLAYSLVRIFLSELSSTFKMIHTFIEESIKDYRENITEEKKRNLYEKATKTHSYITEIIDKLKIIIQRESTESSTLKSLLIMGGRNDKRTSRYRPVVMKCLEQATILEKSLKLMLSITNDEEHSVSSEESLHIINIYE